MIDPMKIQVFSVSLLFSEFKYTTLIRSIRLA